MAVTCKQCGTEIPADSNGCPACGYGSLVKLKLIGESGELSTAIDLEFGKTLAAKVCGADAKYMDDIQFFLKIRDDSWSIKPFPRVKNPVFINDSELLEETILNTGDRISLKDKAAFIDVNCI